MSAMLSPVMYEEYTHTELQYAEQEQLLLFNLNWGDELV